MKMDSFQDIRVFVQIARSGNFTAAGREMDLSPSTVSKCVTRLEKKIGARLFNRTTHSVRLSEEGRIFLSKASKVIDALYDAESLIEEFSSSPSGRLRVYVLPSFAIAQLTPVLPEFLAAYPEIQIDIQIGSENIDGILSDIDVILRYGHIKDTSLISRKLADSRWVICASKGYLDNFGTPRTPEDLLRHNCLGFSLETRDLPWTFGEALDAPKISGNIRSNHAPMLRALALRGVGIIRVADFVVADDIRSGMLVPLLSDFIDEPVQPLYALYQPQPLGAQRIRAFVEFLHQKFSRQTWL